jgi:bacteriocin biosynthesis cyclodehydratase domain-containing protein
MYQRDERWQVRRDGEHLLATAGADLLLAVDDVALDVIEEIVALWQADQLDPTGLSAEAADVFEQLKTAGVVRNALAAADRATIEVRVVGRHTAAGDAVRSDLAARYRPPPSSPAVAAADLVVVVRTTGRLDDVMVDYETLTAPHLLVDAAYDHTVSLGPLVFPGETACLGCLAGRLVATWGDPVPPPSPRVQRHPALLVGLVGNEVDKILAGHDRGLVNRTVAYDVDHHTIMAANIYKLPMCPHCGRRGPMPGAIRLPWLDTERGVDTGQGIGIGTGIDQR